MTTAFFRASVVLPFVFCAVAAIPALARQSAAGATPSAAEIAKQFHGVHLGMARDEISKLIGKPDDRDDDQEVFSISRSRRIRVYYDADLKARAVVSTFIGDADVPSAEAILGTAVTPAADGSVSASVRRTEEGYSLSYNRIVADPPMVMITIQKL